MKVHPGVLYFICGKCETTKTMEVLIPAEITKFNCGCGEPLTLYGMMPRLLAEKDKETKTQLPYL